MKLFEIFDAAYYDYLQDTRGNRMQDDEESRNDTETSMQDFIITQFEIGELSYNEALKKLKEITPKDEMFFYQMELDSAKDLMDD